jgi:hypothetical protein
MEASHSRPKGTEIGSKQEHDALQQALKRDFFLLHSLHIPSLCNLLEGSPLLQILFQYFFSLTGSLSLSLITSTLKMELACFSEMLALT